MVQPGIASEDVFFGGARSIYLPKQPLQPDVREYEVFGRNRPMGAPEVVGLDIVCRDWSFGYKYSGPLNVFYNRISESEAIDQTIPGNLVLAQLVTNQTSPVPAETVQWGCHWANCFNRLMIFNGETTNLAAFKETSSDDPTIVAVTYNPLGATDHIISVSKIVIDSANNASERLMIGVSSQIAQMMNDENGTIDGTAMHATTTSCYGVIQTSLPHTDGDGFVLLGYFPDGLKTASTAQGEGQTWAAVPDGDNINDGGCAIGEFAINGAPPRAYFWEPNSATLAAFPSDSLDEGRIVHFTLDGFEKQVIHFNNMPNGVLGDVVPVNSPAFGQGFIAHNRKRAAFHNGSEEIDLHLFTENIPGPGGDASANSGWIFECCGFREQGGIVDALIMRRDLTGTIAANLAWWRLEWETLTWQQISAFMTASADLFNAGIRGFPVSTQTGFSHVLLKEANWEWNRQFIVPPGQNPWLLHRNTSLSGTTGKEFEQTGAIWSPFLDLPMPPGTAYLLESISMEAELSSGGNGALIQVTTMAQPPGIDNGVGSLTFSGPDILAAEPSGSESLGPETSHRHYWHEEFPENTSYFYRFRYKIDMERGTGHTRVTPILHSLRFRILCFLGGEKDVMSRRQINNMIERAAAQQQARR